MPPDPPWELNSGLRLQGWGDISQRVFIPMGTSLNGKAQLLTRPTPRKPLGPLGKPSSPPGWRLLKVTGETQHKAGATESHWLSTVGSEIAFSSKALVTVTCPGSHSRKREA